MRGAARLIYILGLSPPKFLSCSKAPAPSEAALRIQRDVERVVRVESQEIARRRLLSATTSLKPRESHALDPLRRGAAGREIRRRGYTYGSCGAGHISFKRRL